MYLADPGSRLHPEMVNAERSALISTARVQLSILEKSEIARDWAKPSALAGLTVGGLAAHVTTVLASCHRCINDPDVSAEPIAIEDYYTTFTLTEPDTDANKAIITHGEERARHGAEATASRFREQLEVLEATLPSVPSGRTVQIFGLVPMNLEDFFLTRALEFTVHADDLASSVGLPPPNFDRSAMDVVIGHLASTARHRHGDAAVLRGFTRRERDDVEALRVL